VLAAHRNPESYVAGAVPINREGPRFSADIDMAATPLAISPCAGISFYESCLCYLDPD
jgi:hypothetical protein